ncbi:hypothetical protein BAGA_08040 [Bacillus gaemokensis]|uniref:Uncharacterized protein n=1 Tax=Bacillus gaemokensis TaxID=574375 RepID=A0A073JVY7_9BACI|nr:hypothetical protein BAGA_08040 [Bacillus gaemokensis]
MAAAARQRQAEAQQRRGRDHQRRDIQRVDQPHQEGAAVAVGGLVGQQAFGDGETGRLAEVVEAHGDAALGQVGVGVPGQPAHRADEGAGDQQLRQDGPGPAVEPESLEHDETRPPLS